MGGFNQGGFGAGGWSSTVSPTGTNSPGGRPATDPPDGSSATRGHYDQIQDFEFPENLGVYEPFHWTPEPFVTLSPKGKAELYRLCSDCAKRDMAARRMEVEQAWEAELFERGYQYLFPRKGGGWQLSSAATGKTWSQMQGAQVYETNIYGAHCEILTSALVRDIPTGRFEPVDPNSGPDVTAAEKAEEFKEVFAKNNDLKAVHTQAADYMCTDGRVLFYTSYVLDGQRFGFDENEADTAVVPEDEAEGEAPAPKRTPRGREIVEVLGKLAHKVPITAKDIHSMDFIQAHWDVHEAKAKARFPWIEKQIKPGGGVGEIGIDRIARINVALALEGGYVTGDTFSREVTITYTWLRPSAFYDIADLEIRQEYFDNFPDGCLAAYAGNELAFVRNESMDDHLEILQALSGTGQNRAALMSKVLPIQKRLNNWIDLQNDFFIKTVPTMWMDGEIFNVAALANRAKVPGDIKPFQSQPGRPATEIMFMEPMPTAQPALPDFIKTFFSDFSEMLSGALPSLAGADTDQDTYRGLALQRASALGRLNTPWGRLQSAAATYNRQAVMCAAKCRPERGETQISWASGDRTLTMEVSDLKGNVLCYPEEESNFPETADEKATRYQTLLSEAPTNPSLMKLLSSPQNMRTAKDAARYDDLDIPEADAVDKQIAEFEILLKKKPSALPNPQIEQAKQQMTEAGQQAMMEGPEAMAKFQPMAAKIMQSLEQLPPLISSYPVAQDASEDHATEAQVCFSKMNSAEGRKLKNGNPQQQAAYKNLHLHWQEHTDMAKKLNPMTPPPKPPNESVSVSVDKMPPNVAAQLLQKYYGVQGSPQDFAEQDATETEQKITEKAADYGRTGSLQ
jgi:hypothetical protein